MVTLLKLVVINNIKVSNVVKAYKHVVKSYIIVVDRIFECNIAMKIVFYR
jgi:hypothetical protein